MGPDGDPVTHRNRHQNLITWSVGHALHLQEISSKSVHNFFSFRRTDKQTEVKTSPRSSAEVIIENPSLISFDHQTTQCDVTGDDVIRLRDV